jgi:hypothetical protein
MSLNSWVETLNASQIDSTALTNTVTATSIIAPQSRFTIPANYFSFIGKTIRVRAMGRISTVVTTPGTLTLDLRFGASTVQFNGGAMALNIVAKTNVSWSYEAYLTCRSIGNGTLATLLGMGQWASEAVILSGLPSVSTNGIFVLPAATPVVGTGFDSTVSNVLDMFGTWSVANAANSIQTHLFTVEAMN